MQPEGTEGADDNDGTKSLASGSVWQLISVNRSKTLIGLGKDHEPVSNAKANNRVRVGGCAAQSRTLTGPDLVRSLCA